MSGVGALAAWIERHVRLLLWLAGTAIIAGSFAFEPGSEPSLFPCLTQQLAGLPCPGCGMTRAFVAIAHGRLATAWELNPFSFPLFTAALAFALWPVLHAAAGLLGLRARGFSFGARAAFGRPRLIAVCAVAWLAAMWTWNFVRIFVGGSIN